MRTSFVNEMANLCEVVGAAEDVDALVPVNQFKNFDFARLKCLMRRPRLIDVRNVYDPERAASSGFEYEGVGRGRAHGARRFAVDVDIPVALNGDGGC